VGTTCLWVFITPGGGGSAASAARGELSNHTATAVSDDKLL
jgi:hypothetical protein